MPCGVRLSLPAIEAAVAQIFNLLYLGFAIRTGLRSSVVLCPSGCLTACRRQFGDTITATFRTRVNILTPHPGPTAIELRVRLRSRSPEGMYVNSRGCQPTDGNGKRATTLEGSNKPPIHGLFDPSRVGTDRACYPVGFTRLHPRLFSLSPSGAEPSQTRYLNSMAVHLGPLPVEGRRSRDRRRFPFRETFSTSRLLRQLACANECGERMMKGDGRRQFPLSPQRGEGRGVGRGEGCAGSVGRDRKCRC